MSAIGTKAREGATADTEGGRIMSDTEIPPPSTVGEMWELPSSVSNIQILRAPGLLYKTRTSSGCLQVGQPETTMQHLKTLTVIERSDHRDHYVLRASVSLECSFDKRINSWSNSHVKGGKFDVESTHLLRLELGVLIASERDMFQANSNLILHPIETAS